MAALELLNGDDTVLATTPLAGEAIARGAEARLRHSYLALRTITCESRGGTLVLRGCLPTYYLKQIAQEAVNTLEGVDRVVNEIEVQTLPRRGTYRA
jgi:osmotically-inducible protein OsmY